jgi:hypothetical protein
MAGFSLGQLQELIPPRDSLLPKNDLRNLVDTGISYQLSMEHHPQIYTGCFHNFVGLDPTEK